ncbi:MAG: cysteine desulfurase [Paludibacteraceae bacterium]|nr:cysteine desulfurase [Paludibacteraceae bacterium]
MNRNDFPILNETVHKRPLVYLDNAATSQKPQAVIDAITEAYTHWNSNIHRGVHHLSQLATMKHEEARKAVAEFIGAKSSDEIIFTKGTTDSINALAFSFGEAFVHEGDEIIVSAAEHHSNIVPWQMLCARKKAVLRHIPLQADQTLDIEAFKGLLNEKTKLVSVAHVSNVLGIIHPVEEIIRLAHEKGVPVCIDGAQSVPHMKVDVQALDCDFLAFSGHKMYGPTGIGVLYGKREWLEKLPPHEGGGEMINHVRWSGTTYNELPYKFEAGTPNFVGSYALHKAIEYMQSVGLETIEAHERELTEYCESRLKGIQVMGDGLRVKVYAAGQPKAGVISFNVYSHQPSEVSRQPSEGLIHPFDIGTLLDQQGVAVRTGHHCAEPLIDDLGVPGTVRVSFGLYNDKSDVDAFIAALEKAIMMLS